MCNFVLDKLSFDSLQCGVVSFGSEAIILSWIEKNWRTPRLPVVRVMHFDFLDRNSRLFGTAKPVKPPLTISFPLNYCYQRINPKRILKYHSFAPPAANVFVRRENFFAS